MNSVSKKERPSTSLISTFLTVLRCTKDFSLIQEPGSNKSKLVEISQMYEAKKFTDLPLARLRPAKASPASCYITYAASMHGRQRFLVQNDPRGSCSITRRTLPFRVWWKPLLIHQDHHVTSFLVGWHMIVVMACGLQPHWINRAPRERCTTTTETFTARGTF